LEVVAPDPQFPTPIFLGHEPKIIGWCKLRMEEERLMSDIFLTSKEAYKMVRSGKLKGMSICGIASQSECSVCNSNYYTIL
jgi:hypothetical protein